MLGRRSGLWAVTVFCLWLLPSQYALSQDVEPRRWTPMPTGINVIGLAYANTTGDIGFDPALLVEDVETDVHSLFLTYARSIALFGRSARIDAIVPWQDAHWKGLVDGEPASASRTGMADPIFRLSINLVGVPAMGPEEFMKRGVAQATNTVVGAALIVSVPLGQYYEDTALNLGENRYMIRPQFGAVHTRGKWSFELTGSTFFYSDNDEFNGDSTLERDPVLAVQAHAIRVFKPGYWGSLSAAYGWGGESTINDEQKNDDRRDFLAALSFGIPITPSQGLKFVYLYRQTNTGISADIDTLSLGWSMRF